ncbi:MAG TPA: rhomboid family intramembrane serine protease [Myxococcales bacterium]|nr:rhomboid family intramembrane serine protease [Myxococcales bacterium]
MPPPPDTARAAPAEVALRSFADRAEGDQAAVALVALGIPSRVAHALDRFDLLVPVPLAFQAKSVLDALDAEAKARERQAAADAPPPPSLLGWLVASALAGFYFVTGSWSHGGPWFAAGVAEAARIRAGEWFRAVTALTLHADLGHVTGNAIAAVVFVGPLAQWLGIGTAAWIALLAGAAGNLAAAWLYGPGHSSVGASTAIFGALGALTALTLTRRARFRQRFLALGAGLALLGLLGTGQGADLGAHATGFAAGGALGLLAGLGGLDRLRGVARAQGAAAALALASTIACWGVALRAR